MMVSPSHVLCHLIDILIDTFRLYNLRAQPPAVSTYWKPKVGEAMLQCKFITVSV